MGTKAVIKVKTHHDYGRKAKAVEHRDRQLAVEMFEQTGQSQHSGLGMMLPFILQHCEEKKIPYVLTAYPGMGYHIKKGTKL